MHSSAVHPTGGGGGQVIDPRITKRMNDFAAVASLQTGRRTDIWTMYGLLFCNFEHLDHERKGGVGFWMFEVILRTGCRT